MIMALFSISGADQNVEKTIEYSEFLSKIEKKEVRKVTIRENDLIVSCTDQIKYKVYAPQDTTLVSRLLESGIEIEATAPKDTHQDWMNLAFSLLPLIMIIGIPVMLAISIWVVVSLLKRQKTNS